MPERKLNGRLFLELKIGEDNVSSEEVSFLHFIRVSINQPHNLQRAIFTVELLVIFGFLTSAENSHVSIELFQIRLFFNGFLDC